MSEFSGWFIRCGAPPPKSRPSKRGFTRDRSGNSFQIVNTSTNAQTLEQRTDGCGGHARPSIPAGHAIPATPQAFGRRVQSVYRTSGRFTASTPTRHCASEAPCMYTSKVMSRLFARCQTKFGPLPRQQAGMHAWLGQRPADRGGHVAQPKLQPAGALGPGSREKQWRWRTSRWAVARAEIRTGTSRFT